MKKIIVLILLLLLFLLPNFTQASIIARDPTMAIDMHIISNDNVDLGDAGYFYIPSVEIGVSLYYKLRGKDNFQKIVDAKNSALYLPSCRESGCGYIVDHASQGFDKIKECKLGNYAYIKTEEDIRVFKCIEITYGENLCNDLLTIGHQYLTDVGWAELCCYTCSDSTQVNIIMLFFKEIK